MTVKHIQLRQQPEQRESLQEFTLDGVRIRLRARYVAANDRWFISTYTTADVLIVGMLALVPAVDLWAPYKHLAIPQGQLFVRSANREPPNFETLDVTARLLYRTVT